MRCINEACSSNDVEIVRSASSSLFKKTYQSIGCLCCFIGASIPQLKGPAIKAGIMLEDEIKNKSITVQYRCKKCGCVWTKKKVL